MLDNKALEVGVGINIKKSKNQIESNQINSVLWFGVSIIFSKVDSSVRCRGFEILVYQIIEFLFFKMYTYIRPKK